MKKIKDIILKCAMALFGIWMSVLPAFADNFMSLKTVTEKAGQGVKDMIASTASLISWIMLLISLPLLLWAFIRRGKEGAGGGQGGDALMSWGTGLLIAWGMIQLILLIVDVSV